jgi:dTDP-4-dehydrorhamnose 3,5-epimerase
MQFKTYNLPGPALISSKKIGDSRGYFMETFKTSWFHENISEVTFVQDNQSLSTLKGTIRGLHFQRDPLPQGKLVRCIKGAIFDVAVDIRKGSSTFGKWIGEQLTDEGGEALWIPEGFAHGYCTLVPDTEVFYKVTNPYSAIHEAGIAFDDPDIGIIWPINLSHANLSDKDRLQPKLMALF